MSAVDDQTTYGRARLSFAKQADIDEFVKVLGQYERGEITPDQWRTFRLVRGTYGQRQAEDAQMLRIKIPQGLLTTSQLYAMAEIGEKYSRGFGHITTRQNVQFHFVKLHDVEPAMRELAATGLTTREACGNSVRNITGCPYAGVSADEHFDITPHAEELTRFLLRHRLSGVLPRKFKIAFEGCTVDHIATGINDLAFTAALGPGGGRGFRVTAGGGTALMCTEGGVIHEFLPTSEIFRVAEAILRVFHRYGDYQHKQRNRMKFMIKSLGWARWRDEYDRELAGIRLRGEVPTLDIDTPADEHPALRVAVDGRDHGARHVGPGQGAGHHAGGGPGPEQPRRGLFALARVERAGAEAIRLRDRRNHGAARRHDERADAGGRGPREGLRRRHRPRDDGSEPGVPMGEVG
jgi:sulfite reductase (NADPH) hemoprotein beta-component